MKVPKPKQLPSGKWFVRVRVGGADVGKTFATKHDAEIWASARKANYMETLKGMPVASKMTTEEMVDEYLKEYGKGLSQKTVSIYRNAVKAFPYAKLPFSHVKHWQSQIDDLAYAPLTINLYWSRLCTVWKHYGLTLPKVILPSRKSKQKDYIHPEEMADFLECLKGHEYEYYYLLMLHGCRAAEALNVKKEDFLKRGIRVRGTKTAASDRLVPYMHPRILELDPPAHATNSVLNYYLKLFCKENGYPEMTCHSLRISCATYLYSKNVSDRIIMQVLGWSSLRTMHEVYIRVTQDDAEKRLTSIFVADSLPK